VLARFAGCALPMLPDPRRRSLPFAADWTSGQDAASSGVASAPSELVEQSPRTIALDGEQADEDLVAERWRPCGPPREPRAKRPLAACRQAKDAPKPRTDTLVTPRHQAAPLEVMEELIDLPDVRMPEGPEPLIEQLE